MPCTIRLPHQKRKIRILDTDSGDVRANAYDMVINGVKLVVVPFEFTISKQATMLSI